MKNENVRQRDCGIGSEKSIHVWVEETEVIYLKNHEFKYKKKELNTVFLTVSTFVYPHLWLFKHRQELEVVKGVIVESIE